MCGITGFVDRHCADFDQALAKMTGQLQHRGPDDGGYWFEAEHGVALGHRRLSIIDLSPTGSQPMFSSDKRFVISYNGEIYNFHEIRKKLEEHGTIFRGTSDTEVMLEAFNVWGINETLSLLNGMFAFALWDRQEKIFYLVRDRLGVKPLYYSVQLGKLFFGSELKSIIVNPKFSKKLCRPAVDSLMRKGYIEAPLSIYEDIQKLPPGTIATWNLKNSEVGQPELKTYWTPFTTALLSKDPDINVTGAISHLHDLLRDSIKIRMISDVPLGAFLSGGIDSSLVVAIMQELSTNPVKTFSIGFFESGYNEAGFAKEVAAHLGTDHTELYVTPGEALAIIPHLPKIYDEPFGDPSMIPTLLVSKLTRQKVTVSLSGDGGDELFLGYNRYFGADSIWNIIKFLPTSTRKALVSVIRFLSPKQLDDIFRALSFIIPQKYRLKNPGEKLHRISHRMGAHNFREFYGNIISHWPQGTVLLDPNESILFSNLNIKDSAILDNFSYMSVTDITNYLVDDILVKLDRASMAYSLEAREPLLDYRIVELALSLPTSVKYRGGTPKWILRKILDTYLPQSLYDRPKMGFSVPIDTWLRNELKDWASDLLDPVKIKAQGIFNPQIISHYWTEHLSGRANHMYLLWDALMFQAWTREHNIESIN